VRASELPAPTVCTLTADCDICGRTFYGSGPAAPAAEKRLAEMLAAHASEHPLCNRPEAFEGEPAPTVVTLPPVAPAADAPMVDRPRASEGKPMTAEESRAAREAPPSAPFAAAVDGKSLRAAVALAAAASDQKSTMPILANVVLRCDKGELTVEATDLNVHLTAPVILAGNGNGTGAYTVGAKTLAGALPKGNGPVAVAYDSKPSIVIGGAKLIGLPACDFPAAPKLATDTRAVPRESLLALLTATVAAIATDQSRYHLCGVMLGTRDGGSVAVATDGHRLQLRAGGDCAWPWTSDIIVPLRGVQVLIKALKASKVRDVAVGVTTTSRPSGTKGKPDTDGVPFVLSVIIGDTATVSVKLVDALFPPYERVVPPAAQCAGRINLDRAELDAALESCGKMAANKGVQPVKLTRTAAGLTVATDNPDKGEMSVDVPCTGEGKLLSIGINAAYLRDWLATCDESTVTLDYSGELDPLVAHPSGTRYALCVVMPMRV
jgi:DNA polymerase-3 subunit beta